MHIPDNILAPETLLVTGAFSAAAVGYSIRKVQRELEEQWIPTMGILGAFIFAAQMVNFPIPGGTSGHFVGGAFAAIMLGPWAAVLILTTVLVIQCLLFADGGVLALAANVFNMAVIGCLSGYVIYRLVPASKVVAAGVAAWGATILSSLACALELAATGKYPAGYTLLLLGGIHAVIGFGEAMITVAAMKFLAKTNLTLIRSNPHEGQV